MAFSRESSVRMAPAKKCEYRVVELRWPLEWCEMAHALQNDQFRVRDAARKIFSVVAPDEFLMLALDDGDGYVNLSQVLLGIVGLRSLHHSDRFHECLELVRCGR